MRKPFYWASRKAWYIRVAEPSGRLATVYLGDTRSDAYDEWDRMKRAPQPVVEAPVSSVFTVAEVVSAYTSWMESRASLGAIERKTVSRRIDHLAPFVAHIGTKLSIDKLKPHHVTAWLNGQTTWGATTRGDAARELKRAIQWAANEELIERNPIAKVKPETGNRRDFVISTDDFAKLLAEVWKWRGRRNATCFRSILIALKLSGCRPSEVLSLEVTDFDGQTWTIRQHKNRKKQHPRVVYLSPCLQTLARIHSYGRERGPLFRPDSDRGWKYSDIRRRFERLKKRAGVDLKCVLYSFRHTWITKAMLAGIDVATVAEMAGTSIQMIDRHYGHLRQDRQHMIDAARKVLTDKAAAG